MTKRTSKRPTQDTAEDRHHVYLQLRNAFGLIKGCMSSGLFMPAYITAFSIIEDRIFAMYVVAKRAAKEQDEPRDYNKSILKYSEQILSRNVIDKDTHEKLVVECGLRNKRVHGAMWRLDEYTKENTEKVVSLARRLTEFRKAQSKQHGIGFGAFAKTTKINSK
jgi:hypothetical protein